jgi:predicted acylesterase/phospholipase RssA
MSSTRRILAIDGGGIKGACPIGFLEQVEAITGEQIVDHFDLIVGTSTGGIIALGLGLGLTASRMLSFYRDEGPCVFGELAAKEEAGFITKAVTKLLNPMNHVGRRVRQVVAPKHRPERLRSALERAFEGRLLGESLTRLVIPAYHPVQQTVYVFKTSHSERLEVDHRCKATDVALATAAAPTYFPAHELVGASLIDGGIWANNPVGLAVVEAIGVLGWDRAALKVLSLGCTDEVYIPGPRDGIAQLNKGAIELLMQGQSRASLGTAKILVGPSNFHRISPSVPRGQFSLDGVHHIPELIGLGAACAREALPMLRREFITYRREAFVPFHGVRAESILPRAAFLGQLGPGAA